MSSSNDEFLSTRVSLLERMKDLQDNTSWQDFFDTYWKLIFGVARKAGLRPTEAEDVVQEVMAGVAKDIAGFKYDPSKGSFKSWLLIKTRWKVVEQFRRRGAVGQAVGAAVTDTSTDPVAALPDPASLVTDEQWEVEWQKAVFEAALAKVKPTLDPEKLQVFDFYVIKGWRAEKVAETFRVSVDDVYLIKHRITKAIEAEVQRMELGAI